MKIEVLEPHGFCAGVTAALRKALALSSDPNTQTPPNPNTQTPPNPNTSLYCLHELVHNEIVVGDLKARGFTFVEDVNDVPEGATVLFSAHGVSPAVRAAAEARKLKIVDATCPFVAKVHRAAKAFAEKGLPVVILGDPKHAEVQGIRGEIEGSGIGEKGSGKKIGVVSQTTMNADEVERQVAELRKTYDVETMAEVCQAKKVRQDAVKAFCLKGSGIGDQGSERRGVLVLGSRSSSNSKRLVEVAESCGARAFLAGTLEELEALDFAGVETLGVTSGASTPESFFSAAVAELEKRA